MGRCERAEARGWGCIPAAERIQRFCQPRMPAAERVEARSSRPHARRRARPGTLVTPRRLRLRASSAWGGTSRPDAERVCARKPSPRPPLSASGHVRAAAAERARPRERGAPGAGLLLCSPRRLFPTQGPRRSRGPSANAARLSRCIRFHRSVAERATCSLCAGVERAKSARVTWTIHSRRRAPAITSGRSRAR
jgi:hypothetical protein